MLELPCHLSKLVSQFNNLCQFTFVYQESLNSFTSDKCFAHVLQMIVSLKYVVAVVSSPPQTTWNVYQVAHYFECKSVLLFHAQRVKRIYLFARVFFLVLSKAHYCFFLMWNGIDFLKFKKEETMRNSSITLSKTQSEF